MDKQKIVVLHGFSDEEALAAMKAIRSALPAADAAFAMSTPTSMEWKMKDLFEHIGEEHRQFRKQGRKA